MTESKILTGQTPNPIDLLAKQIGGEWPHISQARKFTQEQQEKLQGALRGFDSNDTSIVVFGSLARGEATEESDVDWTLLVDGIADPEHMKSALIIKAKINELYKKKPGPEGTFGTLAFSHQILNVIGGEDDSNANTTRRILLMLESKALGNQYAWDRVQRNVLKRYVTEDRGLWIAGKERGVPLFLLNDIARYWRTMVVDFAYKQHSRGNKGYALRNIKLGMSRKLIYMAGLLACFNCDFGISQEDWQAIAAKKDALFLVDHLLPAMRMSPLELVAGQLAPFESLHSAAKHLFDAYDAFLEILSNAAKRKHLDDLKIDDLDADAAFGEARRVRRAFGDAALEIFLDKDSKLYNLTTKYGVF